MIRFENIAPEIMQAMCTPMHQILSQNNGRGSLYLGSLSAVMDKELLREHRISHVVQVIDSSWIPLSEKDGYSSYLIEINDHVSVDIRPHLEGVCNWIDRALKSGRNVLVHCHQVRIGAQWQSSLFRSLCPLWLITVPQGVSRSPSVIIAYLIRNMGMTFDNAVALVQRQRACIKPNSGFVAALREWEQHSRRPAPMRRTTA
jgi:hypothetical protein